MNWLRRLLYIFGYDLSPDCNFCRYYFCPPPYRIPTCEIGHPIKRKDYAYFYQNNKKWCLWDGRSDKWRCEDYIERFYGDDDK